MILFSFVKRTKEIKERTQCKTKSRTAKASIATITTATAAAKTTAIITAATTAKIKTKTTEARPIINSVTITITTMKSTGTRSTTMMTQQ